MNTGFYALQYWKILMKEFIRSAMLRMGKDTKVHV